MATFEVTLPDRIESNIDRLVEQGDFLNREQAIEELLTLGISAQETGDGSENELSEDLFTQAIDDQQDPAGQYEDSL
ncbi:ribbon-helix-helix domain-containing protein [Haladaptatus caseinilyticus]|uniref:ribbon-helix-helix domain-containing protein n=1 Tax=Haladaptatus caseinilyticus TaxID=2993314 RepID=UPI00224AF566|nr:ribbon-helix-helix domain-containing protein [Haladaptatus caseinilyticus]